MKYSPNPISQIPQAAKTKMGGRGFRIYTGLKYCLGDVTFWRCNPAPRGSIAIPPAVVA
jgi:hypothetical protein